MAKERRIAEDEIKRSPIEIILFCPKRSMPIPIGTANGMNIRMTLPIMTPISEYVSDRSVAMIVTSGGMDESINPNAK